MPVVIIRRIILMGIQHDNLLDAFRMRIDRMDMQIAKADCQRAVLFRRYFLVTQKQHLMTKQAMIKLLKLSITQWARHIQV